MFLKAWLKLDIFFDLDLKLFVARCTPPPHFFSNRAVKKLNFVILFYNLNIHCVIYLFYVLFFNILKINDRMNEHFPTIIFKFEFEEYLR